MDNKSARETHCRTDPGHVSRVAHAQQLARRTPSPQCQRNAQNAISNAATSAVTVRPLPAMADPAEAVRPLPRVL